ncbi:twin-arginine translocase TatA/TatE family subunit [Adhaeretor mobilis]|uniref:Sec-independent translocase n=1 Tax=Adhaeretor mobilis TaxID=1930276 RepID=A0A517MYG8_9BACT|nr:twin-arginine translocase TatA/TatE family subunit [Adhaeretor mobilis]QDS99924.1 sec-independent translocase [Adhaeretor mobilis]
MGTDPITFPFLAFWSPGPTEMLLIGVIALLLYGGRLPDVAKEWGKTFSDLRRNLTGVQNDFREAFNSEPDSPRLEYHPDFRDDSLDENTLYEDASVDEAVVDKAGAEEMVNNDMELRGALPSVDSSAEAQRDQTRDEASST